MSAKRIMVVEDEAIVAFDIQTRLEEKGYEVPAVLATGEEAIQYAGELKPDPSNLAIALELAGLEPRRGDDAG